MKTKILILASNPKGTPSLEFDTEIRDLRQAIERAPDRDRFTIEDRLAVRPKDLQAALLEVKPRIVHFGGHGEGEGGIVLQNDSGQPHLVSTEALADLFRHFSHQIECVLLNACYSQVQAEEIVKHINFVIGMRQSILDRSAIVFSEGFYGALGAGASIAKAYEFGRNRIHLEFGEGSSQQRKLEPVLTEAESSEGQVPQHLIPRLFINKNPTPIEQPQESESISQQEIISRELITTSPYKGLKAFESRDKDLFFGRDIFISTLVDELEYTNLILLLGASGSGKSSLVRAGLIPWLEKKYGARFTNLTLTPDADPFDSFYASLLGNKYTQAEAKIAREAKAETLIQVANNLKQPDEFWFIFVDQFEELFTISDENKCHEFINGLMKLSQAKLPNVKIMATMRADFLERLSDYPQLVEATQKHRPMIVEMQPNELRLAIEQPAAHHGIVFEAGLVDTIIAEVQGQAGCLSLLQYTLNLVWEDEVQTGSINDRTLNVSTYQKLGGVRGALQQHVNCIYEKLSPSEQLATQRIFLKLVGISENAESGIEWKPVRRRAQLSEFGDDERNVLLNLVNENLLVSNADLSANDSKKGLFASLKLEKSGKSHSTIEITHEILLTSWKELNQWIQKNRQGIALRNRLYEDVKRWADNHKPEDELWTGSKLEQVLELRKDDNFNQVLGEFNTEANQFIDASKGLRDRELRRARRRTFIASILAGLASIFGVFAFVQQQEAQKQSIISMTQTSEAHLFTNNQLDAMVEAIKAKKKLDRVWIGKGLVSLRVLGSLGQAVHHNQKGWKERLRLQGTDVIFSPDGKKLATRDDKIVRLWSVATGKQLQTLIGHEREVNSVAFSPDGQTVATASWDYTARLWRVGNIEDMLAINCDWVRHYLASNPNFEERDRKLCDDVRYVGGRSQKSRVKSQESRVKSQKVLSNV